MSQYKLIIEKQARNYIFALSASDRDRIYEKLTLISSGLLTSCDIKKLEGIKPASFRLRVGKYRLVFVKKDDILTIVVVKA